MPRGKANGSNASRKSGTPLAGRQDNWGGFINVRLSEEDKAAFAVWSADRGGSHWSDFAEYLAKGFKFSLSYDPDGDFYLATFTAEGKELIGVDLRCCLTARAPEWETAVSLLMFKHEVLAHENWGSYRPAENRFDRLG
ncbi:MAG TPA: hypothetical protein VFM05_15575 [Candidatus Saccharimonadales bacterium]|nr:hypothetical protein [Candidatus Saccharimonadales bacterium]